jgi:hypothetical protein
VRGSFIVKLDGAWLDISASIALSPNIGSGSARSVRQPVRSTMNTLNVRGAMQHPELPLQTLDVSATAIRPTRTCAYLWSSTYFPLPIVASPISTGFQGATKPDIAEL